MKRVSNLSAFPPIRDPLLFKKIPCHLVALSSERKRYFNVSFRFGTILLRVSFTYQRPIFMYNHPLNSSLFGIKFEQQSFLETSKTVRRILIALCTVSSMLAHIPQILHHMQ